MLYSIHTLYMKLLFCVTIIITLKSKTVQNQNVLGKYNYKMKMPYTLSIENACRITEKV